MMLANGQSWFLMFTKRLLIRMEFYLYKIANCENLAICKFIWLDLLNNIEKYGLVQTKWKIFCKGIMH